MMAGAMSMRWFVSNTVPMIPIAAAAATAARLCR